MTQLRTLNEYCGGVSWSKLEWLGGLHKLSGFLSLKIRLAADDALEQVHLGAQNAGLRNKTNIEDLQIIFEDHEKDENEGARTNILNALGAPETLQKLAIWFFKGSNLPGWIGSHLKTLRSIKLYSFTRLSALPPLGELPCLEEIYMSEIHGLQSVGPKFLGITAPAGLQEDKDIESSSSSSVSVAFPKLDELTFNHCPEWEEWEDISEEEEAVSLMPCLKKLTIVGCPRLNTLPRRLLRKLSSSLELNIISCSANLQQYSSAWKSSSQQNPHTIASTSQLLQT